MNHFATPEFWAHHRRLPAEIQQLADKNFALLQHDPRHPSIHFKKVGVYWSARVGLHYRALAKELRKASCGSGSAITASMSS